MLLRILEQQRALHVDEIVVRAPLNKVQWNMITQVGFSLTPFKNATDTSSIATATQGNVIPVIKLLRKKTDYQENHCLVSVMQALLKIKIEAYLETLLYREHNLTTMCGPRMRGSIAHKNTSLTNLKNRLTEKVR